MRNCDYLWSNCVFYCPSRENKSTRCLWRTLFFSLQRMHAYFHLEGWPNFCIQLYIVIGIRIFAWLWLLNVQFYVAALEISTEMLILPGPQQQAPPFPLESTFVYPSVFFFPEMYRRLCCCFIPLCPLPSYFCRACSLLVNTGKTERERHLLYCLWCLLSLYH